VVAAGWIVADVEEQAVTTMVAKTAKTAVTRRRAMRKEWIGSAWGPAPIVSKTGSGYLMLNGHNMEAWTLWARAACSCT